MLEKTLLNCCRLRVMRYGLRVAGCGSGFIDESSKRKRIKSKFCYLLRRNLARCLFAITIVLFGKNSRRDAQRVSQSAQRHSNHNIILHLDFAPCTLCVLREKSLCTLCGKK